MNELVFWTATELAEGIRERKVSAVEVLEAYLEQIRKYNPMLNAIVTLNEKAARERAREADQAIAQGEIWGCLHGVPVTIKDALETAGLRTTSGLNLLSRYVPKQDASVVARLKAAGAIVLGKTNLPTLAMDLQTNNTIFGRSNNPWDLNRTPGGSTGGGGAAIAAGLSPLEIGSDMAGSLRVPAHFNGAFALKTTDHLVSNAGHIPEPPGTPRSMRHMGVLGPMARSVADLRLALTVMAGPDGRRWEIPPVPLAPVAKRPLNTYRLAWTDQFGGTPVAEEIRAAIGQTAQALAAAGCVVEKLSPANFDYKKAWRTWGEVFGSECGSGMPGMLRAMARIQYRTRNDASSSLMRGMVRGLHANMDRYTRAMNRRDAFIGQMEAFLSEWDGWLCPVASTPAITHHKSGKPIEVDGRSIPYAAALMNYATVFNMTGHPVVVLPISQTKEGLPIGVQLVGKRWRDMDLLALAEAMTEVTGDFRRPAGYEG